MKKYARLLIALIAILAALLLASCGENEPELPGTTQAESEEGSQAPTLSECEKNGHTEVVDQAVKATCSKTGLTEGKHCSVCNKVIVAQTETPIDPDAHTEVIDPAKAATCTKTGLTEGKHCSSCNTVFTAQNETPVNPNTHVIQNGICTDCKESFISEGLEYTLIDNSYYEVSGIGTCTDTDIYIPAEYNGLPVKSIGARAFLDCSSLTSISIPDSVTNMGGSVFVGCSSLTSVTIGNGVTGIGYAAFYNCSKLTSVTIGNGVTSISAEAFHGCNSLTYSTYGNAKYLGNEQNPYLALITATDTSITSCEIHAQAKIIAASAFDTCSSLTGITIPDSITSIGYNAFYGCSSLTSITIPDGVTSIGYNAFYGCSSLTGVYITDLAKWCQISFSSNPLSYAHNLYLNGTLVTELVIPDGVASIGWDAFSGCSSLTSITIPDSVTSIGGSAFRGCSSLTSITIPDSVTSIGFWAFNGCNNLTYSAYNNAKYLGNESNPYLALITATNTAITSCEIHAQTKIIAESAFDTCSSLTSITIPDSVTSISEAAFSDCSSLTSITVAEGNPVYHSNGNCLIKTASKTLITGCSASIIPTDGSVTGIGNYAFNYCSSLTSITIPDSVTSIGKQAFIYCSNLQTISFTGTQAQWDSISKGTSWNYNCPATVVCTG